MIICLLKAGKGVIEADKKRLQQTSADLVAGGMDETAAEIKVVEDEITALTADMRGMASQILEQYEARFGKEQKDQEPREAAPSTSGETSEVKVTSSQSPREDGPKQEVPSTGEPSVAQKGEKQEPEGPLFSLGKKDKTPQTQTEAFKRWSNNAPLVTSVEAMSGKYTFKTGERVVVEGFHGTRRPDRVGDRFQAKRATSGPMAFFTASPQIGSNYAQNKSDTSLSNEDTDYPSWFKVKLQGQRSPDDIVRSWMFLPPEVKAEIYEKAPTVRHDDEGNIIVEPGNTDGNGSYDYNLASTRTSWDRRGNPLAALVEDWLNSGLLYDQEEKFLEVLKLSGFPMKQVTFDSPHAAYPFVYKTFIAMQSPLVTSDVPQSVKDALNKAAKTDRSRAQPVGADMWDKTTRTLRDWVAEFNGEGDNHYVWTSIPDKVTDVLRSLGYDGIIDTGGKGGGEWHNVYIPFSETQVKSAIGNKGTFSQDKKSILLSASSSSVTSGETPDAIRSALADRFGERAIKSLEDARILKIVESASDIPGYDGTPNVRGFYDPKTGTAYLVADALTPQTAQATLLHEVGEHFGLRTLLGDKGWRALGAKARLMAEQKGSYAESVWSALKESYPEFRGRENADLSKDDRFLHELLAKLGEVQAFRKTSLWRDIVTAIKTFLVKLGFTAQITEADIGRILEGSLRRVARDAGNLTRGEEAEHAMAGIDQTKTEAFKRWFKESKVVDANGDPLVVYHGTPSKFTTFAGRSKHIAQFPEEIGTSFFTADKEMGRGYAGGTNDPMAVYISMQNPYVHDAGGQWWISANFKAIKAAKAGGHDGVIIRNVIDTAAGQSQRPHDVYVAFRPEQIKSAIGNSGTFDPSNPSILRSTPAPLWYSELARQVDRATMKQAPAKAWVDYINALKQKGVKPDEIAFSGVEDWLAMQQGKVTKDQVSEFLAQNGVKVQEVTLGKTDAWAVYDGDSEQYFSSRADAIAYANENEIEVTDESVFMRDDGTESTKFSQWQLPGGENYRELLLTLPAKDTITERAVPAPNGWGDTDGGNVGVERTGNTGADFRSSHFDQPNILAHVRFNERTDADGKRVLFVEEIQSDWGQAAKKQGFSGGAFSVRNARTNETLADGFSTFTEADNAARELMRADPARQLAANAYKKVGVPSAPFVGKTEAWVSLALKRMIRYAAEHGFERIAFTTGEQQADRYDLSKQVRSIEWSGRGNDTEKLVTITPLDGNDMEFMVQPDGKVGSMSGGQIGNELDDKRLDEVVGKDVAERILGEKYGDMRGNGLKVGGEGMRAFYDRIVPNVANDLLKKFGGGRVGEVTLQGSKSKDELAASVYGKGETYKNLPSELKRKIDSMFDDRALLQPGFAITPELRARALQGMPLFSIGLGKLDASPRTASAVQGALDVLGDIVNRPQTFGRLKNLQTQYHKTTKSPEYARIWKRANEMFIDSAAAMSRPAESAPTILPKFEATNIGGLIRSAFTGKGNANLKDLKATAFALNAGTLINGPSPLTGKVFSKSELMAGVTMGGKTVKLTEAQVKLYQEARAAIDNSLRELAASEAWGLVSQYVDHPQLRSFVSHNPRDAETVLPDTMAILAEQERKELDSMRLRSETLKGDKKEAYDAQIEKQRQRINAIEDTLKRVDAIFEKSASLRAAGYTPLMRFGKYRIAVTARDPMGGDPVRYVSRYESAFEANRAKRELDEAYKSKDGYAVGPVTVENEDKWRMFKGVNPETVMLFAEESGVEPDDVMQTWYREAVSSRSALRRMVHRQGYAGFSEDLPRVIASFITSNGKRVGYSYHLGDMQRMVLDDTIPGDVQQEGQALLEAITNPERGMSVRGFMAAWYLLGSIASATVNATQTVSMSLPWLSQYGKNGFSPGEASKHLAKAYKDIFSSTLEKGLAKAVLDAERDGIVDSNEVFHLYAESMKPLIAKLGSGKLATRARAFMTLWGAPFSIIEKLNRRSTFIAAYRMASEQGKNAGQAYEFATRAVIETQGVYAMHNRPNWARGPIGGTVLIFRQYTIAYLEMLGRMARNGPEGKKAAALALSILFLFGGLAGLPFEDDVMDLIDTVAQTIFGRAFIGKMELRNALRDRLGKELGEFVNSGISAFLPLDFSGRMGMGDILPATGILKPSVQDKKGELWKGLGVAGSFASSLVQASDLMLEGNIVGAAKSAAPKAIGDIAKAVEMATTGEARDTRGIKVVNASPLDAAIQAVGFQPTAKAEANRSAFPVRELIAFHRDREQSIISQWARGRLDNDEAEIEAAKARLKKWNADNPKLPIRIEGNQIRLRMIKMKMERAGRITKTAPKEIRSRVRELTEE
jgi:hypothetical protein